MSSLVSAKRRLQGHVQQGGLFRDKDLRSAQAFQSVWETVTFEDCRLSLSDLRASKWVNSKVNRTTIYGGNFNGANLHGVEFLDCDGEQVSFAGAVLRNVTFRDCRLAYSSFVGASLDGVIFSGCNLHGADLDVAESTNVSYAECNLWSAKAAFGCGLWNSTFDALTCNRFAALLARVHPDPDAKMMLMEIAGDNTYKAVDRLMATQPDTPEF